MVYMQPEDLGLEPLINCWIKQLPKVSSMINQNFDNLIINSKIQKSIKYKSNCLIYIAQELFYYLNFHLRNQSNNYFNSLLMT